MYCTQCGTYIADKNSKFCNQCGCKLNNNDNNFDVVTNETDVKDKTKLFLILGLVEAFLFSRTFGLAVILINEMKYKTQLRQNLTKEANDTKTLMIILLCIGVVLGTILNSLVLIFD